MKLNQVMRRVHDWMDSHALSLAVQKTEVVLLTRKHVEKRFPVQVIDQVVSSSPAVKYLGVVLDCRLNFGDHIRRAANKASAVVANLSRLMVNVGGPSPIKRRLLMRTAEAVMLYGADIWAEALRFQQYREILASVQRRCALRIISAYRTVSGPAALVIAGTIPVHLLALERGEAVRGTTRWSTNGQEGATRDLHAAVATGLAEGIQRTVDSQANTGSVPMGAKEARGSQLLHDHVLDGAWLLQKLPEEN
ncbi:unnamed protein product [Nesidiocoris tenuis]|uniref:Reverse transcriptase domain-containing protein n=1 Tax=Nesidiocoris tenuis TaxID=355587 RepID=A0A6H5GD85_9HEMI|nr:unnamed protein product [Nesidiocoris tenuis]